MGTKIQDTGCFLSQGTDHPKGPGTGPGLQSNECALVGDSRVLKTQKANGQGLDLPTEPGQASLRHVVQ